MYGLLKGANGPSFLIRCVDSINSPITQSELIHSQRARRAPTSQHRITLHQLSIAQVSLHWTPLILIIVALIMITASIIVVIISIITICVIGARKICNLLDVSGTFSIVAKGTPSRNLGSSLTLQIPSNLESQWRISRCNALQTVDLPWRRKWLFTVVFSSLRLEERLVSKLLDYFNTPYICIQFLFLFQ